MANTNTATETAFLLAYNEVRFANEIVTLAASNANEERAIRGALHGIQNFRRAVELARELMGTTELDLGSFLREAAALNKANAHAVETARIAAKIADLELALGAVEAHEGRPEILA